MFIKWRFLEERNNWGVFETEGKSSVTEWAMSQLSYHLGEKIRTSLDDKWDTVGRRSPGWRSCRLNLSHTQITVRLVVTVRVRATNCIRRTTCIILATRMNWSIVWFLCNYPFVHDTTRYDRCSTCIEKWTVASLIYCTNPQKEKDKWKELKANQLA